MMSKMKDFGSIIQNENLLAYSVQWFRHKLNIFLSKSCDFTLNHHVFSISAKACDYNQIVVNQNSKTRKMKIDLIKMKPKKHTF